jgi:hypothetical protein
LFCSDRGNDRSIEGHVVHTIPKTILTNTTGGGMFDLCGLMKFRRG